MVFDIIVNTKVIEDVVNDETHKQRDFICQLCIQCLENKYKLECDKRYKLPNVPYIGEITTQYIRDKKSIPKIEEIGHKNNNNKTSTTSQSNTKKAVTKTAVTFENNRDLIASWMVVRNQQLDLNPSSSSSAATATTNITNPFQGDFRYALLDLNQLVGFINKDFDFIYNLSVAVTCIDQLDNKLISYYNMQGNLISDVPPLKFFTDLRQALSPQKIYVSLGPDRNDMSPFYVGDLK